MVCAACKYEHKTFESNLPFKALMLCNDYANPMDCYTDGYIEGIYYCRIPTNLFVCPNCGTVRAEMEK